MRTLSARRAYGQPAHSTHELSHLSQEACAHAVDIVLSTFELNKVVHLNLCHAHDTGLRLFRFHIYAHFARCWRFWLR